MPKILLGDCLELMDELEDGSVDFLLADLPYGTTQAKWDTVIPFEELWPRIHRVVKPSGAIVLFGAEPFSSEMRMSNKKHYKYDWVWDKMKGMGFLNANKQPLRYHELISVFYQKQCTYNPQMTSGHQRKKTFRSKHHQTAVYGHMKQDIHYDSTERYPRSILEFSTDTQNSSLHDTQKPVALCRYLIRTYSNPGELVLDIAAGSGTTAIAAIEEYRDYVVMEKDPGNYDVMVNRIRKHAMDYPLGIYG